MESARVIIKGSLIMMVMLLSVFIGTLLSHVGDLGRYGLGVVFIGAAFGFAFLYRRAGRVREGGRG